MKPLILKKMWSLLLGVILGVLIYYKIIKPTSFWAEKHIKHPSAWPLVGNLSGFVFKTRNLFYISIDLYKKFPTERYFGYIHLITPALMIRDLDLIKQITVKDFDHFHDHIGATNMENDDLLSKSLINMKGLKWRQMRATLSPAFTSSKMRNMYCLMEECAKNFVGHFRNKEKIAIEMKDIFSRFGNDVIASAAFGIKIDSLQEPTNEFFKMGNSFTKFNFFQLIKTFIVLISPKLADKLGIQLLPQDVKMFFKKIIKDNITRREVEKIIRPDLIHLLMEARKGQLKHESTEEKSESFATVEESDIGKNTKQFELTEDHIVAQALLFFFAGFETASTASCFMAHELATNPDIQKKLQDEIDIINQKYQGSIPYEALQAMKYLDQVISETLRLWPPAFQTDRMCTKEYTIHPQRSSERIVKLEKGDLVAIPIVALHRDPQYFPEPDRFDPERFSEENRSKIVPGSYMPFGAGPRNCIGSRFALLEIKTLFFHLLLNFDIVPVDKTRIPLRISAKNITLAPDNGFCLGLKPRKRLNN